MALQLSPVLDTHPYVCLPHVWLCSVHFCKYRSTKQMQKSLDLLELTLTLYVLEVNVWSWVFLGCVKCENLFLCIIYLISQLNKLEWTHKTREEEKQCSRKCRLFCQFRLHHRTNAIAPTQQRFLNCAALCGSSEKDRGPMHSNFKDGC